TLGGLDGIPGLPFIWYSIKVACFLFVFIWLRATLPRIRYDQLMRVGWQVLLPLSVLNLLMTATVVAFSLPWWVSGVSGAAILLVGMGVLYIRMRRALLPAARPEGETVPLVLPASVRLVQMGAAPSSTSRPKVASAAEKTMQ